MPVQSTEEPYSIFPCCTHKNSFLFFSGKNFYFHHHHPLLLQPLSYTFLLHAVPTPLLTRPSQPACHLHFAPGNCVYFYLVHYTSNDVLERTSQERNRSIHLVGSFRRSGHLNLWSISTGQRSRQQRTFFCILCPEWNVMKVIPRKIIFSYLPPRTNETEGTKFRFLCCWSGHVLFNKTTIKGDSSVVAQRSVVAGTFINPVEIVADSTKPTRSPHRRALCFSGCNPDRRPSSSAQPQIGCGHNNIHTICVDKEGNRISAENWIR